MQVNLWLSAKRRISIWNEDSWEPKSFKEVVFYEHISY